MIPVRPTIAEIKLENLEHNLEQVRRQTQQSDILAMVKANAYGHGLIECSKHLINLGVKRLGVAYLEEAILLRKSGIELPILVTAGVLSQQIASFLDYDLDITIASIHRLEEVEAEAKARNQQARIHLKIDTGMERIGVHYYSFQELADRALSASNCQIIGVYSHLACSDQPVNQLTDQQIKRFTVVVDYLKNRQDNILFHLANSGGVMFYPDSYFDLVRPGLMLFGASPGNHLPDQINLKPVMRLVSQVAYQKITKKGASVSYGATWVASKDTRIITIPIGYGDGYSRSLSNKADVLIKGKRYPVVGRVCMDQVMVDVGELSLGNGDEVVLLGNSLDELITVDELASLSKTVGYEIFTSLNNRIPRKFI